MAKKDNQVTELIARNLLVAELLGAKLEVAQPIRDRGIDLIAYIDYAEDADKFLAVPIQVKGSSRQIFSVHRKYDKFNNLIMVYVWNARSGAEPEFYALTTAEAISVAEEMQYTQTDSWTQKGHYQTNGVLSKKLVNILANYRMSVDDWKTRLLCTII